VANAPPNPVLSLGAAKFGRSSDPEFGGALKNRIDTSVGVTQLFERGRKRELRTEAAQYALAARRARAGLLRSPACPGAPPHRARQRRALRQDDRRGRTPRESGRSLARRPRTPQRRRAAGAERRRER